MSTKGNYRIDDVNSMDAGTFVRVFGGVFEASPWVAEMVLPSRPFTSTAHLVTTFCAVVGNAGREQQLALLQAHPELGTKRPLTGYSAREQDEAGLPQGRSEQPALLQELNQRYRDKFGFPFILAVRGLNPDKIIACFRQRLGNTPAVEFDECLEQVFRIATCRLEDLLNLPRRD